MAHQPIAQSASFFPQGATSLGSLDLFVGKLNLTTGSTELVGRTADNLGYFVVTDVWWFNPTNTVSGFTVSCGFTATAYTDVCAATAVTTPSSSNNFNRLALLASSTVNGNAVPPSTDIYVRCSSSTNGGFADFIVAGFYVGAEVP